MNAREFLEQYLRKTEQIEALQDKIAEIRACAEKCTSVLRPTPGGIAHNDSRLEQLVVKIDSMEQQLGILWEERGRIYIETVSLLCDISDERCRQVLEKRYLESETFKAIEEDLYISAAHVYRLHNRGLELAEHLLKMRVEESA